MIARSQFMVHPGHEALAVSQFEGALTRMPGVKLYVTVEIRNQYHELRCKLAKRAAKRRKTTRS